MKSWLISANDVFFKLSSVEGRMVKVTLLYLILVLTFFQSIIGIDKVDLLQQQGSESFSFVSTSLVFNAIKSSENNIDRLDEQENECSHCSLCQGYCCAMFLVETLCLTPQKSRTAVPNYIESFANEILTPLQRPPISRS